MAGYPHHKRELQEQIDAVLCTAECYWYEDVQLLAAIRLVERLADKAVQREYE